MKNFSKPCLCGDPYCPHCGDPTLKEREKALEILYDKYLDKEMNPEEIKLAMQAGIAMVIADRKFPDSKNKSIYLTRHTIGGKSHLAAEVSDATCYFITRGVSFNDKKRVEKLNHLKLTGENLFEEDEG